MPLTIGTSQVKIRNVQQIDFLARYNDGDPLQNTMLGENIEQGVTLTITQGTTTNVANGAKVSTSEKLNVSWTLLGSTLEQMETAMSFTGAYPSLYGIKINSVRITLIGGKTITILKPVVSCSRTVKVGDLFKFSFSIEKSSDNIDDVVLFN